MNDIEMICAIPGFNPAYLDRITLKNQEITDFKVESFGRFPKLATLDLAGNKINHLHKAQFEGIHGAFNLYLMNNGITAIDKDCFEIDWDNALDCRIDLTHNPFPYTQLIKSAPNKYATLKKQIIDKSYTAGAVLGLACSAYVCLKHKTVIEQIQHQITQYIPNNAFLRLSMGYGVLMTFLSPSVLVSRIFEKSAKKLVGNANDLPCHCTLVYQKMPGNDNTREIYEIRTAKRSV